MSGADAWAARLASGEPVHAPVALVVAHPDDETLWAGAALRRLRDLRLILLTDGAPRDMSDATRLGFATREAYAAARGRELADALAALGTEVEPIRYDVPDQEVVLKLRAVAGRLRRDLDGVACVLTHPYEGGHPDHDAAALAVRLATRSPVVEFACYAQQNGERVFGRFAPVETSPERVRSLDAADRERVGHALSAHASQAHVFGDWRPGTERWRAAPLYDFGRPPPGEASLYDGFGWSLTSDRWRALAAAALEPA